ncbi:YchJ family protein [Mycobacterium sp. WMMD1722]|uniref:YchJ family protein n=1 Tax=Mycobacterium sp. WMMD1722 TaxID=3404117 RepID=UPI003BF48383
MSADPLCPCGSGTSFGSCCGPLIRGERQADTPEELMRSRYSAYAAGDLEYVWRTWHPRTRPDQLSPDDVVWTGLQVVEASGDEVEFVAQYRDGRRSGQLATGGTLHERSRFAVRARRWFYVDGEVF